MDWARGLRSEITPKGRPPVGRYQAKSAADELFHREETPELESASKRTPASRGSHRGSREENDMALKNLRTPRRTPPSYHKATPKLDSKMVEESPQCCSPRAMSVISCDEMSVMTEDDFEEGDSVQVFIRVRPPNDTELKDGSHHICTQVLGTRTITLEVKNRPDLYTFTFDHVLPDGSGQDEVFEIAGLPIVENCIAGYNSSIFAYGQTGAGKTYTMGQNNLTDDQSEKRGLAPRVFEHLFQRIAMEEDNKGRETLKYNCRCSFLEIYNEVITDLLNPAATNLQIREDIKKGCYIEGLSEESVVNVQDILTLMRRGAENRHVGETRLNRESSRSHSVFTCIVERSSRTSNNLTNVVFSRLNLIDLAGSERTGANGGSGVQGIHFKEAVNINKSLTTLGRVISELVEAQRSGRKGKHIPYRDSRLTFLLQDSLGGNAKTMIIANVSPSSVCCHETLSTLSFAKRAKHIKNNAIVNVDTKGDVAILQREIQRLNAELENLRSGFTDPAIQENAVLHKRLEDEENIKMELNMKVDQLTAETTRFKRERNRMEEKLVKFQNSATSLQDSLVKVQLHMSTFEKNSMLSILKLQQAAGAERDLLRNEMNALLYELQREEDHHKRSAEAVQALEAKVQDLLHSGAQHSEAHHLLEDRLAQITEELQREKCSREEASGLACSLRNSLAETLDKLRERDEVITNMHDQLAKTENELTTAQQQLEEQQLSHQALLQESERFKLQHEQERDELIFKLDQTHQQVLEGEALRSELSNSLAAVRTSLDNEESSRRQLQEDLEVMEEKLVKVMESLEQERNAHDAVKQQLSGELGAMAEEKASLEHAISTLKQQLEEQESLLAALGDEKGGMATEMMGLKGDLDQQRALVTDLRSQIEALQETLQAAVAERDEVHEQLEESQGQCKQVAAQLTETEATMKDLETRLQDTTAKMEDAEAKLHDTTTELDETKTRLDCTLSSLDDTCHRLESVSSQLAATTEEVQKVTSNLHQMTEERDDLQREVQSLKSSLDEQSVMTSDEEASHAETKQKLESKCSENEALCRALDAETARTTELQQHASQLEAKCGELDGLLLQERGLHEQTREKLLELEARMEVLLKQMEQENQAHASTKEQVTTLEARCVALNTSLEDEGHAHDKTKEEVVRLEARCVQTETQLLEEVARHKEEIGRLEGKTAELQEHIHADAASHMVALNVKEEDIRRLKEMMSLSEDAHQQQEAELSSLLGQLKEEKTALLGCIDGHIKETAELKQQVSEWRQKSASDGALIETLRQNLKEREHELVDVRRTTSAAAARADAEHKELCTQVRKLQKEAIQCHEEYVSKEFSYKGQISTLTNSLDLLKKEQASLEQQMVGKNQELQALRTALAEEKALNVNLSATVADRERSITDLQKESRSLQAELRQVSEVKESCIVDLKEEMSGLKDKITDQEVTIKDGVVRSARHTQAFQEIRRLIDWATVPTHEPCGASENDSPVGSPRPRPSRYVYSGRSSPCPSQAGSPDKNMLRRSFCASDKSLPRDLTSSPSALRSSADWATPNSRADVEVHDQMKD